MIFHENRLLADDSHKILYLTFSKIGKDLAKFVVCCSRDMMDRIFDKSNGINDASMITTSL